MPELVTTLLVGELLALAGVAVLVAVAGLVARYVRGRRAGGRHSQTRHRPGPVAGLREREHADQPPYTRLLVISGLRSRQRFVVLRTSCYPMAGRDGLAARVSGR